MAELSVLLWHSLPVIAVLTVVAQMVDRVRVKMTGIYYCASQNAVIFEDY